jgi:hypothetical protein
LITNIGNLFKIFFFAVPTNHYKYLRNLLFENIDPIIASQIERAIEETIGNYEPRVRVSSVNATAYPEENRYSVTMTFFIINSPNPITIDFFLERIR